jgi:4-amino-4-deoxychorismate lyase
MNPLIYSDGNFSETATISADDHGALYGAGFFETFRTRGGVPVRLEKHLARLHAACERLGIRIPDAALASSHASEKWTPVIGRLLAAAGLKDGVFRLTVTAGEHPAPLGSGEYLHPHERLTVRAFPPAPPAGGVTLHRLNTLRDTGEWSPRPKSLNYLNTLLAARELATLRDHPADEGMMLDARGHVSEGVFANILWVREGVVFTPREDTGCLPGIGRAHLLARLREAGVKVAEVAAGVDALTWADAVAMVSCVRGVVPVARITDVAGEPYWKSGDTFEAALAPVIRAFGE